MDVPKYLILLSYELTDTTLQLIGNIKFFNGA